MNKKETILEQIKQNGFISVAEAESLGVSRRYLYKLYAQGFLEKSAKGLFIDKDGFHAIEHSSIIEAVRQVGECTVSLLSALSVYGITTQLPHEVWITLPRGRRKIKVQYPPINYTIVDPKTYSVGRQEHLVGHFRFQIYSPARTVADCFKFRSKVGLDVAIEALREVWKNKQATMDEITDAAKVCRVLKVMKPYMEAIV